MIAMAMITYLSYVKTAITLLTCSWLDHMGLEWGITLFFKLARLVSLNRLSILKLSEVDHFQGSFILQSFYLFI